MQRHMMMARHSRSLDSVPCHQEDSGTPLIHRAACTLPESLSIPNPASIWPLHFGHFGSVGVTHQILARPCVYDVWMTVRIRRLRPDATLPRYAHGPEEDAGMDLVAVEDIVLKPGVPVLVPTGLAIELPAGYEAQIRPRSGLALKHAITVPNSPATIDPGYRGEIRVILLNLGGEPYEVKAGHRIAQMIIARYEAVEWMEEDLSESNRGDSGFGKSGY